MTHNVPDFLIAAIVIGYVMVAIQFGLALPSKENQTTGHGKRATALFVAIFVLCAVCGYLPRLIPVSYWIEVVTHALLVCATWFFVLTNQARVIARSLR